MGRRPKVLMYVRLDGGVRESEVRAPSDVTGKNFPVTPNLHQRIYILLILKGFFRLDGAGTRNRTQDLLITNQLLYQLSYAGTRLAFRRAVYRARGHGRAMHPFGLPHFTRVSRGRSPGAEGPAGPDGGSGGRSSGAGVALRTGNG